MTVSCDPIWKDSEMATQEGDFYMATFREGRIRKVGCKMKDGPPLRVRRVLDFNSKVERAKEQALTLKRKQLGCGSELQAQRTLGEKEKTLAEVMLEMKRKKIAGGLATVQRQPPLVKQVTPVAKRIPVAETIQKISVAETIQEISVTETVPVNEEIPMEEEVALEEEMPATVASPRQKKRKRKSTSRLHTTSSELIQGPLAEVSALSDEHCTLAEWLKKTVVSATGRASSDNAGIKVFQRRKVKLKAIRRRPTKAGAADDCSKDDRPSSPVTVCEILCDCDECSPTHKSARNVQRHTRCSRVSTTQFSEMERSIITIECDDHPEDKSHIHVELPVQEPGDLSIGEFDALTLPDDSSPVPVDPPIHERDIEEKFLEVFCGEVVAQALKFPLSVDVTAPISNVSSPASLDPGNSESLEAASAGPEDMPEVLITSETRPQLTEDTSTVGDVIGQGSFGTSPSCSNSASVVTPMELELAEVRIDALVDTLVTPDELLPIHLSTSKSAPSKSTNRKKTRSLCETVEGSSLGAANNPIFLNPQEEDLTEQISLDLRERILKSVTVNLPNSVSDPVEESLVVSERSPKFETVDLKNSEHDSMDDAIPIKSSELVVLDAHDPVEEIPTPMDCMTNEEAVFPSFQQATPLNAEELSPNGSDALMVESDVVEVTGTPVSAPVKSTVCNEDSSVCQIIDLDVAERDAGAASTSTSQALFSNLTTDGLSKRNRKSFSPNSRLALIEAARSERTTPTFKIKLMKSKMGNSKLEFRKKVKRKAFPLQDQSPLPDDSSAQDSFQFEVGQIQLIAPSDLYTPQTTENSSLDRIAPSSSGPPPDMSAPPPDSSTRTLPGSPEYQKEPSVSLQTDVIRIPDNSVVNLTEGCLSINLDCRPESATDPCTPSAKVDSPPQPKSILKTRSVDPDIEVVSCQGFCKCPRCKSTCDQSEAARDFIKSQMIMANNIAAHLITELQNIRAVVEDDGEATPSRRTPSEQAKVALESATKTEAWATKEILKLSRDSKRVCRLIETGPRRTIFADDAGRQLCHVKILPAKKNTLVNL